MKSQLELLYRLVVFAAFLLTAWFTIPGTFWPHAVLDVLGLAVPRELLWAGFAFQLTFLVSLYSLPVLIDWQRYFFNAIVLGALHVALAVFWIVVYSSQTGTSALAIGLCELVLGVTLLALLQLMRLQPHVRGQACSNMG